MKQIHRIAPLFSLSAIALILMSCAPGGQDMEEAQEVAAPPAALTYDEFNNTLTIRDVMNALIDPNADIVWDAVSYDAEFIDGEAVIVENSPETEEQWDALRLNVVAMIEGANSLMIPGRRVAPPGATTDFPDYEYVPEEVEARLSEDRQSWLGFAQAFQQANLRVLDAIAARDLDAYVEAGGEVDDVCTACHQQYWYRPEFQ